MKSEAVPIGQKLIAAERDLDAAFAERTITPEKLQAATAAIAEIQGQLRDTHLKYHLATAGFAQPGPNSPLQGIARIQCCRWYAGFAWRPAQRDGRNDASAHDAVDARQLT